LAARLRPKAAIEEGAPATSALARREKAVRPAETVLGPDQSAALREQLLGDIGQLQSADEAADWVHKNLATKNTLIDVGDRGRMKAREGARSSRGRRGVPFNCYGPLSLAATSSLSGPERRYGSPSKFS